LQIIKSGESDSTKKKEFRFGSKKLPEIKSSEVFNLLPLQS